MAKIIEHDGTVIGVDGAKVQVRFVQLSACSDCHARALCSNSSDSAEKVVEALTDGHAYAVGDSVVVTVGSDLAWSAVMYAFMLPLVVGLIALFVMVPLVGEMTACLATLATMGVYYVILWTQRHRLERRAVFRVRHRF